MVCVMDTKKPLMILCTTLFLTGCLNMGAVPTSENDPRSPASAIATEPNSSPTSIIIPVNTAVSPSQTLPIGTPTPPAPPEFPIPGIELSSIDARSSDLLVQAGAYWVRRNALYWSAVEGQEGERNWDALATLEDEMIASSQRGLQLILIVRSTPVWAQQVPGYSCGPIASDKISAFGQFMYETVLRYSAPPFNVKYWELGNEPDIDPSLVAPDSVYGCMGDKADLYYGGGAYAEMLKIVYPQIKAADPNAQVLVGGLLLDCDPVNPPEGKDCSSSLFIEGILRGGGGDYFDGISFHAYDYYSSKQTYGNSNWNSNWDGTGPVMIAKARYLRSLLFAYKQPGKYLLDSEAGVICWGGDENPNCRSEDYMMTKANYTVEVNTAALAEGLRANVWYSLFGWRSSGLVDDFGQPNQALTAFRFNATQLLDSAFSRLVTEAGGVRGYELVRPDTKIMILWSIDGETHVFEPDVRPQSVYNVFGEPIDNTDSLLVGRQPVYLIWESQ